MNNDVLLIAQKRTLKAIMLKDLVNCDKVSYFFEEAPTSYSINSAGGQAKEAPSPLIQDRTMNTFK